MHHNLRSLNGVAVALLLAVAPPHRALSVVEPAEEADLPRVVITELKHLEETYRVLDVAADKVWPGWTDYRNVPFLFEYRNGLKVLVGHPNPPAGYELLADVRVENKSVAVDRRNLLRLELEAPLRATGGIIRYGATDEGDPVETVHMRFSAAGTRNSDGRPVWRAEHQILTFVHELFHTFQNAHFIPFAFGNLHYNPDVHYATYSEIEGQALLAAWQERDQRKAVERLEDFIVARDLKRRSMTAQQRGEESADDLREGTANYAMVRTLEVLRESDFTARLSPMEAPSYNGFRNVGPLIDQHVQQLRLVSGQIDDPKAKCYEYGAFQALLSQRLFPGWQRSLAGGESDFIDQEIRRRLALEPSKQAAIERRLGRLYPIDSIRAKTARVIGGRDAAFRDIRARKGEVYIVDFKTVGVSVESLFPLRDSYRLGWHRLYPKGTPGVTLDDINLSRIDVPFEAGQLYYLRLVGTAAPHGAPAAFSVNGAMAADGSYVNATVTTPHFTLRAPRMRIDAEGDRVKIKVLSRVKED
jgi:hypothetical protein